jgi:hypothetical protein
MISRRPAVTHTTLALTLAVCLTSVGSFTQRSSFEDYEKFGPRTVPLGGNIAKMMDDLRSFIWRHWKEHRRGCASVTMSTMEESVPCTSTYIIEPNKQDHWQVLEIWSCKGSHRPRNGKSTWASVQRLAKDNGVVMKGEELPESADVPSSTYVLQFSDSAGHRSHL